MKKNTKNKIKKLLAAKLAAIAPWILIPFLLVATVAGVIDELGADSVSDYSGRVYTSGTYSSGSSDTEKYTDEEGTEVVVPPGTEDPIDYLSRHGALPEMTDEEKRLSFLEEVSINDMVKAGEDPFTDDIEEVYKNKTAVIETEYIQKVRTVPSEAKLRQVRQDAISERISYLEREREAEEKRKAEEEEKKKKEEKKKASQTPAPTKGGGKNKQTQTPAPTQGTGKNKNKGGAAEPKPAPTNGAAPTPSAGATPATTPRPSSTPKPTKTVSSSPSPSPSPTPKPITESDFTDSDWKWVNEKVDKYKRDNSKEEDVSCWSTTSFSPDALVEWLNEEFRTPWQAIYGFSVMLQQHNETSFNSEEKDLNITMEAVEETASYFNSELSYALMINYWGEDYDGKKIAYDERETKLSYKSGNTGIKNYIDWDKDYSDEPILIKDDDPDTDKEILSEKGFTPVILLRSSDDWAHRTVYGEMKETVNSYGFHEQKVVSSLPSSPFNEFVCGYDFSELDLEMIGNTIEALPYSTRVAFDFDDVVSYMQGTGVYIGSTGSGALYNLNDITWLTGNSDAEGVCRSAMTKLGAIYSQKQRYSKGYFDCSSLVYTLYKYEFGYDIGLPTKDGMNTTAAGECERCDNMHWTISTKYDESVMQPGDILFWSKKENNKRYLRVYHTGIYMGNGIIIDASSSHGKVVCREMWGKNQIVRVARPCQGLVLPSLGMSPDAEAAREEEKKEDNKG